MHYEIAVAIMLIITLTLMRLPLGIWLPRVIRGEQAPDFLAGIALAPALGIAATVLLAAPLYMYVGPAEAWAWPVLALLLMLSTGALGASLGQLRADPKQFEGAAALSLALLTVMETGVWRGFPTDGSAGAC